MVLSYNALRGYLSSAPGSKRAALETVSKAVLCLRLSTWIALVEHRRNPMTGFSMASRYAVRNQPLAFDDTCLEDEDDVPLLERAPSLAQPADTFFPPPSPYHRRYSFRHIALLSLATLPLGLPTGSKADALFEATGELSIWPLPFGDLALANWQKH
ncbi:MAG: hypothetical protein LBP52_00660 [Burkholderiaceae bacterium]|nr:hypothetical protein [Burkholderiaceae bacterium]